MDDCHTPTMEQLGQVFFNRSPTVSQIPQDLQNLMVNKINMRCYTPTLGDFRSPGLSPIYDLANKNSPVTPLMQEPFKIPDNSFVVKKYRYTPSPIATQQHQPIYQSSIDTSLGLNSSALFKLENDSNSDSGNIMLNASRNSSILNHTLNVTLLLQNVGLEEYSEMFAREGINIEKFLSIQQNDLHKLGLQSDEHCKTIMNMLKELNTVFPNQD